MTVKVEGIKDTVSTETILTPEKTIISRFLNHNLYLLKKLTGMPINIYFFYKKKHKIEQDVLN